MVGEELTDGERIARLLSSEVHGHERGVLGRLSVVDAADDVDPTDPGTFAYAVADGERRLAEVYAHPDRAHVEFLTAARVAAEASQRAGLRVRPKAVDPPRTLAFVESGAEVKPALRVVRAVGEALEESG